MQHIASTRPLALRITRSIVHWMRDGGRGGLQGVYVDSRVIYKQCRYKVQEIEK
jgi:hypothetical protein